MTISKGLILFAAIGAFIVAYSYGASIQTLLILAALLICPIAMFGSIAEIIPSISLKTRVQLRRWTRLGARGTATK